MTTRQDAVVDSKKIKALIDAIERTTRNNKTNTHIAASVLQAFRNFDEYYVSDIEILEFILKEIALTQSRKNINTLLRQHVIPYLQDRQKITEALKNTKASVRNRPAKRLLTGVGRAASLPTRLLRDTPTAALDVLGGFLGISGLGYLSETLKEHQYKNTNTTSVTETLLATASKLNDLFRTVKQKNNLNDNSDKQTKQEVQENKVREDSKQHEQSEQKKQTEQKPEQKQKEPERNQEKQSVEDVKQAQKTETENIANIAKSPIMSAIYKKAAAPKGTKRRYTVDDDKTATDALASIYAAMQDSPDKNRNIPDRGYARSKHKRQVAATIYHKAADIASSGAFDIATNLLGITGLGSVTNEISNALQKLGDWKASKSESVDLKPDKQGKIEAKAEPAQQNEQSTVEQSAKQATEDAKEVFMANLDKGTRAPTEDTVNKIYGDLQSAPRSILGHGGKDGGGTGGGSVSSNAVVHLLTDLLTTVDDIYGELQMIHRRLWGKKSAEQAEPASSPSTSPQQPKGRKAKKQSSDGENNGDPSFSSQQTQPPIAPITPSSQKNDGELRKETNSELIEEIYKATTSIEKLQSTMTGLKPIIVSIEEKTEELLRQTTIIRKYFEQGALPVLKKQEEGGILSSLFGGLLGGILGLKGVKTATALMKKFIDNIKNLPKTIKNILSIPSRILGNLSKIGAALGGAYATMKGFSKAKFSGITASFQKFFDAIKSLPSLILSKLHIDKFVKVAKSAFEVITTNLSKPLLTIKEFSSKFMSGVFTALNTIKKVFTEGVLIDKIISFSKSLASFATGIMPKILSAGETLFASISPFTKYLTPLAAGASKFIGPIGLVITAISSLVASVEGFIDADKIAGIKNPDIVQRTFAALCKVIEAFTFEIIPADKLYASIQTAGEFVKTLSDNINTAVKNAYEFVKSGAIKAGDYIASGIDKAKDIANAFKSNAKTFISDASTLIKEGTKAFIDESKKIAVSFWEETLSIFRGITHRITNAFGKVWDFLANTIANIGYGIQQIIANPLKFKDILKDVADKVGKNLKELFDTDNQKEPWKQILPSIKAPDAIKRIENLSTNLYSLFPNIEYTLREGKENEKAYQYLRFFNPNLKTGSEAEKIFFKEIESLAKKNNLIFDAEKNEIKIPVRASSASIQNETKFVPVPEVAAVPKIRLSDTVATGGQQTQNPIVNAPVSNQTIINNINPPNSFLTLVNLGLIG